jgi:phosphomannomutase
MTLIKSISGIRGTIGGNHGEGLNPPEVVMFTAAYGTWIQRRQNKPKCKIVIGRDARISGEMINSLVSATLCSIGIDVVDLGLSTTPTVEIAVTGTGSDGGIIITASHNPAQWNALKLLNENGEFLSAGDGNEVLRIASEGDSVFADVYKLGYVISDNSWLEKHIGKILELKLVDITAIRSAKLTVAIDCVNSVGGIVIPQLLEALGVERVIELNCVPNGIFSHNPEPLPENLKDISDLVLTEKADLAFVVDPDADRLAIVCEDGTMFGEEYTLVAVADYILKNTPGNTVSNMSSTRALKDITDKYGYKYSSSEVGEVNVVALMKSTEAIIGGEGNGGVIYPELHYGRDALAGIALFLTHLSKSKSTCSGLRKLLPEYTISKKRIDLDKDVDVDSLLESIKKKYNSFTIDERDGLKIEFEKGWIHIRKSNTEPIIRIYAEASTKERADSFAEDIIRIVKKN